MQRISMRRLLVIAALGASVSCVPLPALAEEVAQDQQPVAVTATQAPEQTTAEPSTKTQTGEEQAPIISETAPDTQSYGQDPSVPALEPTQAVGTEESVSIVTVPESSLTIDPEDKNPAQQSSTLSTNAKAAPLPPATTTSASGAGDAAGTATPASTPATDPAATDSKDSSSTTNTDSKDSTPTTDPANTDSKDTKGTDTKTQDPVEEDKGSNVYRIYNPYTGEHFYTENLDEAKTNVSLGWRYEGVGWVAPSKSGEKVWRLYNPYAGDHHYTSSTTERDALVKAGWKAEGYGWLSGGDLSVLRQYNQYAKSGTHNFTLSKKENDALVKAGWKAEGSAWSALTSTANEVTPFWVGGPSGRWWVQRDGSYAQGRVITPNEDGNPGIYALATSGNGHVVRGAEKVGNDLVVANRNTGELVKATGWWVNSAPTGGLERYFLYDTGKGYSAAKTGRFTNGGYAAYGVPGKGYVLRGRMRLGNGVLLADNDGRLFEKTGFQWFKAADEGSSSYYYMGNYCTNSLIGARIGYFSSGSKHYYADSYTGRIQRNANVWVSGRGWYRAGNNGVLHVSAQYTDMFQKAQQYSSATGYLLLVDRNWNRVAIYNGSYQDWYPVKEWRCTTGAAGTRTPTGSYKIGSRGYVFGNGFSCYYWTQFNGEVLFHSVLYYPGTRNVMDGRLGINASHGCVRLDINNAKWIYDNVPKNSRVIVF